jgi:hypothetical protein
VAIALVACYPKRVRWLVGLVTSLCLLAATAARPDDPRGDTREQPQLLAAKSALTLALRRDGSAPELRLPPFALAVETSPRFGRGVARGATSPAATTIAETVPPAPSARGPPRG